MPGFGAISAAYERKRRYIPIRNKGLFLRIKAKKSGPAGKTG